MVRIGVLALRAGMAFKLRWALLTRSLRRCLSAQNIALVVLSSETEHRRPKASGEHTVLAPRARRSMWTLWSQGLINWLFLIAEEISSALALVVLSLRNKRFTQQRLVGPNLALRVGLSKSLHYDQGDPPCPSCGEETPEAPALNPLVKSKG